MFGRLLRRGPPKSNTASRQMVQRAETQTPIPVPVPVPPPRTYRTKQCLICTDDVHLSEFPRATSTCSHEQVICTACLQRWVGEKLRALAWNRITCPNGDCGQIFQYDDVKRLCTPEIFAQYDTFAIRDAVAALPDCRWCIARAVRQATSISPSLARVYRRFSCDMGVDMLLVHTITLTGIEEKLVRSLNTELTLRRDGRGKVLRNRRWGI